MGNDTHGGRAQEVLSVRDITTVFPTASGPAVAVNGVSFDVRAGETVGIVGESGSGKSVTCRSVLNLVPPPGAVVTGSVWFEGRDLLRVPTRELMGIRGSRIAMIFQDPMSSLNPVYSIGDQMVETIKLHRRLKTREARAAAEALLDRVGIPSPAKRLRAYPSELSGGMRQRVMIAIAISCRPAVLLADEPTTALDVTIQDQILSLLLELQEEHGMGMVLVSHDLGVIAQTCDRVLVMYAGYLVEEAPARVLLQTPRHPYTMALLNALPEAARGSKRARLEPIPGQPPVLTALVSGCPFAPRCSYARSECRQVSMQMQVVGDGQRTACPYGDEAHA